MADRVVQGPFEIESPWQARHEVLPPTMGRVTMSPLCKDAAASPTAKSEHHIVLGVNCIERRTDRGN
jgi:hypothetical protein